MEEQKITTSSVMSFVDRLEESTALFYEALAERWPELAGRFKAFAQESRQIRTQILRTYQETISDAYEANFAFAGFNLSAHEADACLPESVDLAKSLEKALALEEKASQFYQAAAARCEGLLATIPRAFQRASKKRAERTAQLLGMR
jgi:rubrerythrin